MQEDSAAHSMWVCLRQNHSFWFFLYKRLNIASLPISPFVLILYELLVLVLVVFYILTQIVLCSALNR